MRAQKLAELVISGLERHGWFEDSISLLPEHAPPLSMDEAGRLREARRRLGLDIVYVQACVPSAEAFPPISTLAELHDVLVRRNSLDAEVRRGVLLSLRANTPDVLKATRDLLMFTEEVMDVLTELEETGNHWPFELRSRCRQASFASERSALRCALCRS